MLTPSQSSALLAEIKTGPLASTLAPFVSAGNDGAVTDALNAQTGAGVRSVQHAAISRGAFLRGVIPATDRLAAAVGVSGAPISSAMNAKWASRLNIARSGDDAIHLDAGIMGLIGQMITDDISTQAEIDAFTKGPVSAAEFVIGRLVTIQEVANTLRP